MLNKKIHVRMCCLPKHLGSIAMSYKFNGSDEK